jgi:hypothetical protein
MLPMTNKIELFLSYADEDKEYLKALESQLTPLEGTYPVTIWHKGKVIPGQEKQRVIDEHLKDARIILLLVSSTYLASKYLYEHEVKRAMEYHAAGTAKVVPVLLSPVLWKGTLFGKLEPLPADEKPVSRWNNKSDAFYAIAEGISALIEQLVGTPQEDSISRAVPDSPPPAPPGTHPIGGKVPDVPNKEKTMTPQTFSHGYALLIGVGHDLPITVKDATAVRDVLINPARAAYPPNHVQLLTEAQATRQSILAAFEQLAQKVQSDSEATVIVYFSGHGGRFKQLDQPTEYFLVPYGYDPTRRADTAISGLEFTNKIEAIKARKLVVLLDCCFAGGVPTAKEVEEVFEKAPLPPNLIHILETGSGRVVMASSRENEVSLTGTPYSVFTTCLMEALAGKGASEKDGFAHILDVVTYLLKTVPQRTSDQQHPSLNRAQNLSENFPLCYYAGGNKEVPGAPSGSPPISPPVSMTPRKRQQLEERREMLLPERTMRFNRLKRVRRAWLLEQNPAVRFQREYEIQEDEEEIAHLDRELDEIEQALQ